MELDRALGAARIGQIIGLVALALGLMGSFGPAAWAGAALVVAALLANAAVKIRHFRRLSLTPTGRTRLTVTWCLFVAAISGFLVVAVAETFQSGYDGPFWPLAVSAAVLLFAYRVFQRHYLDGHEEADAAGGEAA